MFIVYLINYWQKLHRNWYAPFLKFYAIKNSELILLKLYKFMQL